MDFKQFNLNKIFEAMAYAAEKHAHQRRKGNNHVPYINHLIKVAKLVTECVHQPEDDLLVAAILHDVVEDTDVDEQEVARRFGEKAAFMVHQMSDDMSMPKKVRKAKQIEKAPGLSSDTKILKIADKIANINDILTLSLDWDTKRKIEYIHWAKKVVDGCRGINPQLEKKFDDTCSHGLKQLAKEK